MKEKFISILIITIILLSGCQNQSQKDVRLSSWVSSPSETAIFKNVLGQYRQEFPDRNFLYQPIPGNYSEKIQLMLGTRTAPDLFYLKGFTAPSYMSFDILEPLDDYIDSDSSFNKNDFLPFALEAFTQDGQIYGIPKDYNPYVLFYNKDMFASSGIDSIPQNWTEFRDACTKLTKDLDSDGKIDQYGFVVEPIVEMVIPFVYQNGGAFQKEDGTLGITDPEFVEAVEFYHGLYADGIATLAQDQGATWNGDAFGRERTAMAISGGWLLPFLEENYPDLNYGIALLPAGKQRATVAFTTAYAMPKASVHKDDAWHLLSYLTGKTGMKNWTETGVAMPTRLSVAEENGFYTDETYKVFMESAEFAKPFQIQYSERGFEELVVAFQAIFFADKEPKQALEDIKLQIEKYKLN